MYAFVWILIVLVNGAMPQKSTEYGSYVNPHPRPYESCTAPDLIKLSSCCNEVLSKLDDCKADDLACECCALQSLKPECFNLCPGNPSNNFLTVLFQDCHSLNDINACSLPFKKSDSLPSKRKKTTSDISYGEATEAEGVNSVIIKSKLSPKVPNERELLQILQQEKEEPSITEDEASGIDPQRVNNASNLTNIISNITEVSKKSTSSSHELRIVSIILGLILSITV